MNLTPVCRRALAALILGSVLAAAASAQSILFTEYDGKFLPVVRARDHRPYVTVDGKQVVATGNRFGLQKTEEYLPLFVSVRDLDVKTRYLNMNGSAINNEFDLRGWLESPYQLTDVFIVLELDTETAGKSLFLQEVGTLDAREPKLLEVAVPLSSELGPGKYHFHIFAGGRELLHSNIPPEIRDRVVDKMTFKRIAGVQDAAPAPFTGPVPEYPKALLKAKTKGQVVIALRVGTNGRVYDPVIKSATEPAFGETTLTAVRLWRFLPKVKNGRPVECHVELPFDFAPPEKKTGKS